MFDSTYLPTTFLLCMVSEEQEKAIRQYRDFVQCKDSSRITDYFNKKHKAPFFGSQEFIARIKETFRQSKEHHEIPQSRQLAPTIAEIKNIVCQSFKVEEQTLRQTKRGQVNEPRNVAIYLARKRCGFRLEEIGKEFGIEKYSSVSSIVVRTEKQLSHSEQLQNRVDDISRKLA